jgi:hypothetical protein
VTQQEGGKRKEELVSGKRKEELVMRLSEEVLNHMAKQPYHPPFQSLHTLDFFIQGHPS